MMGRKLISSMIALGLVTAALSSPSYALQCDSCPPEFGGTRPPPPGHDGQQKEAEPPEGPKVPGPKNPRKEKEMDEKAEKKSEKKVTPIHRYKPGTVLRHDKCILKVNC